VIRRRTVFAALAGLTGCSVLPQPKYVQQTQWPFAVQPARALPAPAHGKVLLVRDVSAAPGLDQRGLQWLESNGSVHVDFYNQWAVSPAAGVTSDLQQWLAGSGLFSAVVGANSGLVPDLILDTELTRFVADPRNLTAHAAAQITVIDAHAVPSRVALQRTVTGDARMPTDTPQGVAEGLRSALAVLLGQVEAAVAPYSRQ
jgi:cholesterol transport system auxiliary component